MTAVTSKMNRMVLLYMLILSMVSLPTSLPKHLLVKTATDPPAINDYTFLYINRLKDKPVTSPIFDYSESPKGPKKNYKKELTKITDDMKRQGKDYGGFTDFLKEAVEVVGPAWKVVGPALKKGVKAVMGQLKKGELFMIPWSFISIFRHSQQSRHFMTLFVILMRH